MIAGELESTLYDSYDYFLFGKNQNKQTQSSGTSRPTLGQRLDKKIDEAGGMEGIGRTLDNVRTLLKPGDPASAPQADFGFAVKKPDDTLARDKEKIEQKKKTDKLIMISALIVGGIIVIGGTIWWVNRSTAEQPEVVAAKL